MEKEKRVLGWVHRLASLRQEIELANGEDKHAVYDDKLESLVRFAHEEACDQLNGPPAGAQRTGL